MPRPFRFAVTARFAGSGTKWRDVARRAEDLGYDVLLVTDHMGPQLAPIPALMAAADATTRLRVGSFVLANDYRNPVMLAKEVATIDVLSGGRVEVGIGAGWSTRDYRELGIPYDAPAVRVSRLEESVALLKRLLSEESVDHVGDHYSVRGARVLPRPMQRPHPPLMIGGGAPRREQPRADAVRPLRLALIAARVDRRTPRAARPELHLGTRQRDAGVRSDRRGAARELRRLRRCRRARGGRVRASWRWRRRRRRDGGS